MPRLSLRSIAAIASTKITFPLYVRSIMIVRQERAVTGRDARQGWFAPTFCILLCTLAASYAWEISRGPSPGKAVSSQEIFSFSAKELLPCEERTHADAGTVVTTASFLQPLAEVEDVVALPAVEEPQFVLPSEPPVPVVESEPPSPPRTEELAPGQILVPLTPTAPIEGKVEVNGGLVTVAVRDAPLHAVLSLLAQQQGLSIVASSDLKQPVTVTLQPTSLENALDALLSIANCTWTRRSDIIYVTSVNKDSSSSPFFQGREVRVFTLNYVDATDIEKVITGLLSPVGKAFVRQVDAKDRRRTAEQIVVEDLPPFLDRAAAYIAEADQMPGQVLVEAHILQVKLGKDKKHGVNFDTLARVSGARMQLWNKGFASEAGPGMVFTVDGTDFNALVDCLTTTTDAKTLASPKVLVVNGQESRIQIGRRLGYFVTTTTQTSTLQDVQFLEVGVVLTVTPHITADGSVLMNVQPKVSSGDINPTTTLPEEETTEVATSILVPDGQGIIIGGLIQENDTERQSKLSHLGDLWLIGHLFQRRTAVRERNEVIVALLPRIVRHGECIAPCGPQEWERVTSPLLMPHLDPAARPWEPELPDATHRPLWSRGSSAAAVAPETGHPVAERVTIEAAEVPQVLPYVAP